MLSILRKNAASWFVKILLGMIVVSFVFFFGYSRISKSAGKGVIASVNGAAVYYSEYQMALDNIYQFYKNLYKGDEVPEYLVKSIRQGALRQLIHNRLLNQLGKGMGVVVTDSELRDEILDTAIFMKDGRFNADFYKNTYLPYFRSKYNIDYEKILKDELLLNKTRNFFEDTQKTTSREVWQEYQLKNTSWTFEVVEVNPQKLVDDKKVPTIEEANEIASKIQAGFASSEAKRLAGKYDLEVKNQTISLEEKDNLGIHNATTDDYEKIFSLNSKSKYLSEPVFSDGKYYAINFVRLNPPIKEWQEDSKEISKQLVAQQKNEAIEQWITALASKASIKSFLPEEISE